MSNFKHVSKMEENEELTGMHLFKKLRHQEKNGDGMSADEWEWHKHMQKEKPQNSLF